MMAERPRRPAGTDGAVGTTDVIDVLQHLVDERLGAAAPARIDGTSRLADDLGLNSLERVELCQRLIRDCGLRLSPEAVAHAATVGDLVALAAGSLRPPGPRGVRFPDAPPWRAPDTPRRSRLFTAYVAAVLTIVGVHARWRLGGRRGDAARGVLHDAARRLIRRTGTSLEVYGTEHLRGVEPAVLVANHQSYIDTVVLLAALPLHPTFVANERLPGAPLLGAAIAAADYLVVDRADPGRPDEAVERMAARIGRGESLLLFPEGTLAPGPGLLPLRLGAFATAVAAGRPVVPISVRGTRQMLPYDTGILGRARLRVIIHPPIAPAAQGWHEVLRLAAEAERHIVAGLV